MTSEQKQQLLKLLGSTLKSGHSCPRPRILHRLRIKVSIGKERQAYQMTEPTKQRAMSRDGSNWST